MYVGIPKKGGFAQAQSMVINMKIIDINEMYHLSFNIININIRAQIWQEGSTSDWTKNKRYRSGVLYLKNCSGEFRLEDGTRIRADKGSLVLLSQDTNYFVTFRDVTDSDNSSYLINFVLTDDAGEAFAFGEKPIVLPIKADSEIVMIFEQLWAFYHSALCSPMKLKADVNKLLFTIVSHLRHTHYESKEVRNIAAGIKYMENHLYQNVSVSQLAKMCSVSTSCFIRAFKKYAGMTPKEYLLYSKIEKAKDMLSSNMFRVNEISDFLGFHSHAYFDYIFKKKVNMSPTEFQGKNSD